MKLTYFEDEISIREDLATNTIGWSVTIDDEYFISQDY